MKRWRRAVIASARSDLYRWGERWSVVMPRLIPVVAPPLGSHSPFITWKGGVHLCARPYRETCLTAVWVPLAPTAFGTGVQRRPIMLWNQSHIFQVSWCERRMNYLRRLTLEKKKKDFAYLWKLFSDVRTITGRFILAEGYFSFWLRVISTILPLFHSPLKPSFCSPNSLPESWYLGYLTAQKEPNIFFSHPRDHFLLSPEALLH